MGGDRWDEVWEGVLHMVPPPSGRHQTLAMDLLDVLQGSGRCPGAQAVHPSGSLSGCRRLPGSRSGVLPAGPGQPRGLEAAAELVIELVSPGDRSRLKLPWYAALDVREVLLLDSVSLAVELYDCASGEPKAVEPAHSAVLDCTFTRLDGDRLEVRTPDGPVVVSP